MYITFSDEEEEDKLANDVTTSQEEAPLFNNWNSEFQGGAFCFVLFCFVLFCFVLFCFISFCFVLLCFFLFCLFVGLFFSRGFILFSHFDNLQSYSKSLLVSAIVEVRLVMIQGL